VNQLESSFERRDPRGRGMPFLFELADQFRDAEAFPTLLAKRRALA
jgi:hypothetical protein